MSKKWKKLEGLDALKEAMGGGALREPQGPDGDDALREPQGSGKQKASKNEGMVYSTDPNYSGALREPQGPGQGSGEAHSASKQDLRVQLERKNRGGKAVTLITEFIGSDDDLKTLGKMLKTKCGVGGSAKNGEIIIQGDHRAKVMEILEKEGYRAKRIN